MSTFKTVKQFAEIHQAFTESALRMLIFNERQNGLAKSGAVLRIGRKVLIDEELFLGWVKAHGSAR